jgi:predicted PurR-regulated permease PerM
MIRWALPALLFVLILFLARPVLTPFIIAAVLAYVFSPLIDELQERTRLPRPAVVVAIYVLLVAALALTIWFVETRLVREVRTLSAVGPNLVDIAVTRLLGTESFQFLGQHVDTHLLAEWVNDRLIDMVGNPTDALHVAERALDTVVKTFLALLVLFYMLLDGRLFGAYALRFVPPEHRDQVGRIGNHVHLVLSRYIRGQLFLVALMSVVTFVVLEFVFRLPFALPIALLTGLLEVIPIVGPIVAGSVAAIVGLVHGGTGMMLWIIAAYFVLRQAEDQLVMPIVVGRAVELHPLVTIFAVLVGGTAAGVLGALLAVPTAAALRVLLDYVIDPSKAGPPDDEAVP